MSWLYPIRFQWLEWLLAFCFIVFSVRNYFIPLEIKIPKKIEAVILVVYLAIALTCKISQWQSLQLHAFDFWLFEDLISHVSRGLGMVTRFAPQEPGALQHGVIHGFWPLVLLSPLVWLFGSLAVTLVFNPAVIVFAGYLLVRLGKRLGLLPLDRVIILVAFLFHFLTTEMLMHEMHPELIYPAVFFWIWDLSLREKKNVWLPVFYFVVSSFKEDAALLMLPVLFLTRASLVSWIALALGVVAHWGGMKLAGAYSLVRVPQVSAWGTAQLSPLEIIDHLGGWLAIPGSWLKFMAHSGTVFLLAACPWLLIRRQFWILWIPYSFLFAFLGDRARLTNYYAAPFIAIFFTSVVFEFSKHKERIAEKRAVLLLVALLIGSNGLVAYVPRAPIPEIKSALKVFNQTLIQDHAAMGVVAAPFLGFVDRDKVWSDRAPIHTEDWKQINYLILPQGGWTSYEIPSPDLQKLELRLKSDSNWKMVSSSTEFVQFWRRR